MGRMFVIAGATGKTGRVVAETLLGQHERVRVIVRRQSDAGAFRERGVEVAIGSLDDAAFLEATLVGAKGFYALLPEDPAVADFSAHRRRMADAIAAAVSASRVAHVVFLSALAAALSSGNGPASDLHHAERALAATGANVTTIRSCFFAENVAAFDGVVPSFLPSADLAIPMIAAREVGRFAARCLIEPPSKSEVVDLLGPSTSMRAIATNLGARVFDVPPAAHVDTLVNAGLPRAFAESVAELFACFASGRVKPEGDRLVVTS